MTIEGLTRVTASTLFVGLSRAESSMRRRFSEQSTCSIFFVCCCALIGTFFSMSTAAQEAFDQAIGIVLHGTIVTMDSAGAVLHDAAILVRNGMIVAHLEECGERYSEPCH